MIFLCTLNLWSKLLYLIILGTVEYFLPMRWLYSVFNIPIGELEHLNQGKFIFSCRWAECTVRNVETKPFQSQHSLIRELLHGCSRKFTIYLEFLLILHTKQSFKHHFPRFSYKSLETDVGNRPLSQWTHTIFTFKNIHSLTVCPLFPSKIIEERRYKCKLRHLSKF